jgi:hypothetical protein
MISYQNSWNLPEYLAILEVQNQIAQYEYISQATDRDFYEARQAYWPR